MYLQMKKRQINDVQTKLTAPEDRLTKKRRVSIRFQTFAQFVFIGPFLFSRFREELKEKKSNFHFARRAFLLSFAI